MAVQLTQRMLDRLLTRALSTATAPSGLRITEGQLYYELCRLIAPAHRLPRQLPFTTPTPMRYNTFRAVLDRRGHIPELLAPTEPRPAEPGRYTGEPDLFDYGLPRLLICASHDIACMLRANGLPMESACPVLGVGELPLHPGMAAMLRRVSGTVYLLHEASADGMGFPARIRARTDLPENVRIVPIGLRPRQAGSLHLFHTDAVPLSDTPLSGTATAVSGAVPTSAAVSRTARTAPIPQKAPIPGAWISGASIPATIGLDDSERRWLSSGRAVELDAVRPAALLRTVHRLVRGVRATREPVLELRRARAAGFLTWPAA